ncbi:HAMP domain-containing protein [Gracilibacillus salitolerans]|uniref:HAMP domain-containing protein n=1 Tax=Gracilibacillus salitolerans TaxID=2663022 RepID=A0A5Q2TGA3_9BACI|nr:sensor histidine kinase [Gracilibacillus salitolerans]QGH33161.1 HAMP domain-containing protein [Gracilibacillus salitolerans]
MKSIQSRLLFMLIIFILLPYFLSVLLIYGYTKSNVEKHELANNEEQLNESSKQLQQYFHELIHLPYILYRDAELFRIFKKEVEDSNYLEKSIQNFYLMREEIRQVRFYMDKGEESVTVYNAIVSSRKSKPDLLQEPYIKKLYQSDVKQIIEPPHPLENYNNVAIVPQTDHTQVITIHHKIQDIFTGEFLGVISMDVELNELSQIAADLIKNKHESMYLINKNNQIVFSNNTKQISNPVSDSLKTTIQGEKESDDIILSKTLTSPLHDWELVKITPSEVLFHDVRKTTFTSIIVGIIVGIFGLVMVGIITYKITTPIKRLTNKVSTIDGSYVEVPFNDQRHDEIGYLEKHMKDMMKRINHHIEREYKLELENKEMQFQALKSQVNPHFLFNALQSIGTVALKSDAPNVYHLITSLSNMMRYSMQANKWVKVKEEMRYIESYLSLQMERFHDQIHYNLQINQNILEIQIPSMILQPLVENFFKHCFEEGHTNARLNVFGERRKSHLYFKVENDEASVSDEKLEELRETIYPPSPTDNHEKEHIGLKNIQDRLVLIYGDKAGINIENNKGQAFIVEIFIPLNEISFTEGRIKRESIDRR